MTDDAPRLDLTKPRELGPLLTDGVRLYFAHFLKFVAIAAAVVVPAELIVSGVGLGELTSGFDNKRPLLATLMPQAVQALVTTPLITAMTVFVLLDLAGGKQPSVRRSIQSGLDSFARVFVPVLAAVAVEALVTLALVVPLVLSLNTLLVPTLIFPVILAVRWYFVAESVVVDRTRGLKALRGSWDLTRGFGWRVFGVVVLVYLAFGTAAALVGTPVFALAKSADSGALVLASRILQEVLAAPAIVLVSALLYFDLKARRTALA